MWHLNLSMDQVSLVVKATLCLILAEQESLNISTVKAVVTLDLWAGDHKFFIFWIYAEQVQGTTLTKREINRMCLNPWNLWLARRNNAVMRFWSFHLGLQFHTLCALRGGGKTNSCGTAHWVYLARLSQGKLWEITSHWNFSCIWWSFPRVGLSAGQKYFPKCSSGSLQRAASSNF